MMPSKLLMTGTLIFGAGVLLVLVLLVTHGGANKAKQFEVLAQLLAGQHGAWARGLLIAGFSSFALGAMVAFSAVSRSDAQQLKQCKASCLQRGFAQGGFGLSEGRDASGRPYRVCRCSGNHDKDLEIELRSLSE